MSGTRPKGLLGPERPQYQPTHNSRQVTQPDAGDTTSPPPLTGSPLLEGRVPVSVACVRAREYVTRSVFPGPYPPDRERPACIYEGRTLSV